MSTIKLAKWAPKDLVSIYKTYSDSPPKMTDADLRRHAKSLGFPSWTALIDSRRFLHEALGRLLSREDMKEVWGGVSNVPSVRKDFSGSMNLYRGLHLAVEHWYSTAGKTGKQLDNDRKEIGTKARELSALLNSYAVGDRLPDVDLHFLVPVNPEWEAAIQRFLNQEFVDKCLGRGHLDPGRILIGRFTPTLAELLDLLGERLSKAHIRTPVTRMGSKSAFRTFLIKKIGWRFDLLGIYSNTTVATFVSVALDDVNVTHEIVRKNYRKVSV